VLTSARVNQVKCVALRSASRTTASELITSYLDWYFACHPVHADSLGAVGYADRFGDFSAASFKRRQQQAAQWLARFETEPDGIDRDLIVSSLRASP
jgi:hypothetical protein